MGCAAVGLGCAGRCEGANRIWGVWGGLQLWDWHTQEDVEVLTWDRGAEGCTGEGTAPCFGVQGDGCVLRSHFREAVPCRSHVAAPDRFH